MKFKTTTFAQSKKLLDIGVNPKTADLFYDGVNYKEVPSMENQTPYWSTEALLHLLPPEIDGNNIDIRVEKLDDGVFYQIAYGKYYSTGSYSDMISSPYRKSLFDVAYEMIVELDKNELYTWKRIK